MKLRIIESLASNEFNDFYDAVTEFKEAEDRHNDIQIKRNGNMIIASGFDFMARNLFDLAREYLVGWNKEVNDPSRFRKQTSYGGTITYTYTKDGYTIVIKMI